MKNYSFWNLSIFIVGVVNYIFEVNKNVINFEVGEICIIIILLSVIIFLLNEINSFLIDNIALKYQAEVKTNFKSNSFLDFSKIQTSALSLNLIGKIYYLDYTKYKTYLTLIN